MEVDQLRIEGDGARRTGCKRRIQNQTSLRTTGFTAKCLSWSYSHSIRLGSRLDLMASEGTFVSTR